MKKNKLLEIWKNGDPVVNGWLTIPSSFSAEVMSQQGFDSIVVDMQHGAIDYQTAFTMIQGISTTDVVPMARVPWSEPAWIMKILDAGAYGVVVPMINTPEQAEELVRICKYPPRGFRSCGPVRAKYACGGNYLDEANDNVLVIPQIETGEALENLDGILSTPGVDAVYVGPSDLAMALGSHARTGQKDEVVVNAKKQVVEACNKHNVIAGIHTPSAEAAANLVKEGYRFVTIASDDRFLAAKAKNEVATIRNAIKG